MNKWPLKMWLWPEQEIAYGYPADPRTIPVFVYPVIVTEAGQEPVAWMFPRRYGSGLSFTKPPEMLDDDGNVIEPVPLGRITPPATIRQEERYEKAIAQAWRLIDPLRPPNPGTYARGRHEGVALALETIRANLAIRALTDEEKEG